jgi:hypothetical protein
MSEVEGLLRNYERFVRLPWERGLAGPQKVWCAIYAASQERRLRLRIPEFGMATDRAGHGWKVVDVTDSFARWLAGQEYRDAYFAEPELMDDLLGDYLDFTVNEISAALTAPGVDEHTVVAVSGLASLFGLVRASALLERVAPQIKGRLLVFFPGEHHGSNYRLLDARDGWNYLAVPITAVEER